MNYNFNNVEDAYISGGIELKRIYGQNRYLLWEKKESESNSDYFTIEALENGNIIINRINRPNTITMNIYYWRNIKPNTNRDNYTSILQLNSGYNSITIPVYSGDKVYFYCDTKRWGPWPNYINTDSYNQFLLTFKCNLSGDLSSIVGFGRETRNEEYVFYNLFKNSTGIVDASNLVLHCNGGVFSYEYANMFYGCSNLVSAPTLPESNNYWIHACDSMFYNCNKLNNVKCLVGAYNNNVFSNWMYNVPYSGTFTKKSGVTWSRGSSGIPYGWSINEI